MAAAEEAIALCGDTRVKETVASLPASLFLCRRHSPAAASRLLFGGADRLARLGYPVAQTWPWSASSLTWPWTWRSR